MGSGPVKRLVHTGVSFWLYGTCHLLGHPVSPRPYLDQQLLWTAPATPRNVTEGIPSGCSGKTRSASAVHDIGLSPDRARIDAG